MFQRVLAVDGGVLPELTAAAQSVSGPSGSVEILHPNPDRDSDVLDDAVHRAIDMKADLLVLSARRRILASRVAMLAPASVLMVPEGLALELKKIIVPVDFSESSRQALRSAMNILPSDGSIIALAVECDDEPWLDWPSDHGRVQEHLNEFVDQVAPASGITCVVEPLARSSTMLHRDGITPAHRIEGADVAWTIVEAAERMSASLIVMGTRGRTKSASVLLGSVTQQVIQQAHCAVLALKGAGAPMNLAEAVLSRLRGATTTITAN